MFQEIMHVRISAHIKWKLNMRPKYRQIISTSRMQQTVQVSNILSYISLSHFRVWDNVYDSYFDHKKMYTSASSCLKSVMTEWWPRNNLKKKSRFWAAASFPSPAVGRVAGGLSATAPATRRGRRRSHVSGGRITERARGSQRVSRNSVGLCSTFFLSLFLI